MPSFSFSSLLHVPSEDRTLSLKITHSLILNEASQIITKVDRLPKELDVLLHSNLTITFSGICMDQEVPTNTLVDSAIIHYLLNYLRSNSTQVGLSTVSDPYIDEDGIAKFALMPSRTLCYSRSPHARLISVHLLYIWKHTKPSKHRNNTDSVALLDAANPFCAHIFLPIESILQRLTCQFATHLVGCYPLVFGRWCQKLDIETPFSISLSCFIVDIIKRSENKSFTKACRRLLRRTESCNEMLDCSAFNILNSHHESPNVLVNKSNSILDPLRSDQATIGISMEHLYKNGIPCGRFKPAAPVRGLANLASDDSFDLARIPDHEEEFNAQSYQELLDVDLSPASPFEFPEMYAQSAELLVGRNQNYKVDECMMLSDISVSRIDATDATDECDLSQQRSPFSASDASFQFSNSISNSLCYSQSQDHLFLEDNTDWTSISSRICSPLQRTRHPHYSRRSSLANDLLHPGPPNTPILTSGNLNGGFPIHAADSDSESDLLFDFEMEFSRAPHQSTPDPLGMCGDAGSIAGTPFSLPCSPDALEPRHPEELSMEMLDFDLDM